MLLASLDHYEKISIKKPKPLATTFTVGPDCAICGWMVLNKFTMSDITHYITFSLAHVHLLKLSVK